MVGFMELGQEEDGFIDPIMTMFYDHVLSPPRDEVKKATQLALKMSVLLVLGNRCVYIGWGWILCCWNPISIQNIWHSPTFSNTTGGRQEMIKISENC